MSKMKDADNWFLLFDCSMPDPKTNDVERIIGFANPSLFRLLNGKIDLHADGLFYAVLKAHDPQTGTHDPFMHALMTSA